MKLFKHICFFIVIIFCLMLMTGCKCMSNGNNASCPLKNEKPARAMGEEVSITATVESIDYQTRNVTLKGPEGRSVTLVVSEEAYNFDQVTVGDLVDINYVEAVVIQLETDESAEPFHAKQKGMVRAPKGQKPEGVIYDVLDVKAIVEDIDYENRTVDLRGTYGNIISVTVDEKVKNFDNIKKGDVVKARYTEAVAISVRPAD